MTKKNDKKIFVTQPALPDLDEFIPYLQDIWERKWLTNNGKYHQQFEKELAEFLGVKYVSLFANGTLALISALQVLRIQGEVITTPYSFVATAHALWWNNIKPVFVDIEPRFCNLDPEKIEAAITPKTTAILPVHVYGNPVDVHKIQEIADVYGLKVIYDAAHAFGVKLDGHSICNFGDLSVLSFHATKMFTTVEGGAIISHDIAIKERVDYLKNFGFANETTVVAPGINAKMNELQAALGILQLKRFDEYVEKRRFLSNLYRELIKNIRGINCLSEFPKLEYNYSYFPVFIDENEFGASRDDLYHYLKKNNIFARRYFYPLITSFPSYRELSSIKTEFFICAQEIANKVLCLPLFSDQKQETVEMIVDKIKNFNTTIGNKSRDK
jgi:dTDP-4-amino-4,6-dideoxygalactose transaminase